MRRRAFLRSSIALSAAVLPISSALAAAGSRARASAPERERFGLERFVFDDRFAVAVDAARRAARQGVALARFSGDLTALWYDDLDLRWKQAPMTLAGITTSRSLFVLETLAADRGMRVARRAEAAGGPAAEPLLSWVIAPRAVPFNEFEFRGG